jgi:hypothetical protein
MALFTDLNDALEQIDNLLEAPASNRLNDVWNSASQMTIFGNTTGGQLPGGYAQQVNKIAFEAGFINSGYTNPLRPGVTTENLASEYVEVLESIDLFGNSLDHCAALTQGAISGAMNDYMRNTGIQEAGRELNKTLGKADDTINCISGFATLFDSKGVLDDAWGLMDMPQLNIRVKNIVSDITDPALLSNVLFNLDAVKDLLDVEQSVCDAIHDGMDKLISKDLAALTGSLNKLAQWAAVAKLATSDPCSLVTNNMLLGHITEPVMDDLIDLYKSATTTQGDVIETAIDIFVPDGLPGSSLIGDIYEKGSLLPVGQFLALKAESAQDLLEGGVDSGADVFDALFSGDNAISTSLAGVADNIAGVDFQAALGDITDISFDDLSLDTSAFDEFTDPMGAFASDAFDMAGGAFDDVSGLVSGASDYVSGVLSAGGGIVGDALSLAFGSLLGGSGLPVTAPSVADVASPGAAGAGAGGGSAKTRDSFGGIGATAVLGGASMVASTGSMVGGYISGQIAGANVQGTTASSYATSAISAGKNAANTVAQSVAKGLPALQQSISTATENFDVTANALSQAKASADWSNMTLGSCFGGSGSTASACASSGGMWRSTQGIMNTGFPKINMPSLGKHVTKRAQSIESVFADNKLFDVSTILS